MRALILSAIATLIAAAVTTSPLAAQRPSAPATYGEIELEHGFTPDPHEVELTAGGELDVELGECSYGYVAEAPDVDLHYEADAKTPLYISVSADEDTMLLVNDPAGKWLCDDDSHGGLDPRVTIEKPMSGLYNIWVGTYDDEMVSATLRITELAP